MNEMTLRALRDDELYHHGVIGMKWGVRRYQPWSVLRFMYFLCQLIEPVAETVYIATRKAQLKEPETIGR